MTVHLLIPLYNPLWTVCNTCWSRSLSVEFSICMCRVTRTHMLHIFILLFLKWWQKNSGKTSQFELRASSSIKEGSINYKAGHIVMQWTSLSQGEWLNVLQQPVPNAEHLRVLKGGQCLDEIQGQWFIIHMIVIDKKYWCETRVKYCHGYVTSKQLQLINQRQVHYHVHKWSQLDFFPEPIKTSP